MDLEAVSEGPTNETASASTEEGRPRSFRSREIVWSTFESMARDYEVSIDELVNEAMAAYARARGYDALRRTRVGPSEAPEPEVHQPAARSRSELRDRDDRVAGHERLSARPQSMPLPRGGLPRVRTPPSLRSSHAPAPPSHGASRTDRFSPREREARLSPVNARQLVLEYRGQFYPVDKERFLIGRSKTQSDLRLDDPNVSRQHAVIERVGAAWYVVDLGSTNGVHVANDRVARRALADADVIVITTHEIHCVLR